MVNQTQTSVYIRIPMHNPLPEFFRLQPGHNIIEELLEPEQPVTEPEQEYYIPVIEEETQENNVANILLNMRHVPETTPEPAQPQNNTTDNTSDNEETFYTENT